VPVTKKTNLPIGSSTFILSHFFCIIPPAIVIRYRDRFTNCLTFQQNEGQAGVCLGLLEGYRVKKQKPVKKATKYIARQNNHLFGVLKEGVP
jgi:hypothetical protein